MRYSAIQDYECGIALGQQTFPFNNDVDSSVMAATGETQPVDESTMIYNLPLLFANGYPTSLETISLPQLEKFITFMVQCSVGHDTTQIINKPVWWPKDVEFSIPFSRPRRPDSNWIGKLKKLVYQCYTYHKSEYLLRFCSYLAHYPREKIYYVNNWDSTTSLYHKSTGKLLATFRNENMDYDKVVGSPRRTLLSHSNLNLNSPTKKKKTKRRKSGRASPSSLVVLQPQTEEIYLCDNCDAEFGDLLQMKNHETACGTSIKVSESSRSNIHCESNFNNDEPELNQTQFMDYFNLYKGDDPPKKESLGSSVTINYDLELRRSSRRVRTTINFARCPTIPFSSPAGIAMAKKIKPMTKEIQLERIERIERNMGAPPLNKLNRPKWLDRVSQFNRWAITYKSNKENPPTDNYVHQYTFGAIKRKPVLSIRSQILYVACGLPSVYLERFTEAQLKELQHHPWKYRRQIPQRNLKWRHHTESAVFKALRTSLEYKWSTDVIKPTPIVEERLYSVSLENGRIANFRLRPTQRSLAQTESITESKVITLVDLCSSDEDDDNSGVNSICNSVLPDENCDPLSVASANNARLEFLKNHALQTNHFLSNSLILTKGNDKCNSNNNNNNNNKCISNGVLEMCKPLLPVYKSEP